MGESLMKHISQAFATEQIKLAEAAQNARTVRHWKVVLEQCITRDNRIADEKKKKEKKQEPVK